MATALVYQWCTHCSRAHSTVYYYYSIKWQLAQENNEFCLVDWFSGPPVLYWPVNTYQYL